MSCAGVGECRRDTGGVMCPSFRVTRDEHHSTRGRARLLFEMLQGDVITDGWRSEEVKDALDLCLSCKGCRSDCPVHVDMATYKAEFLHHYYRGRIRPFSHYALGWLPLWARFPSCSGRPARPASPANATCRARPACASATPSAPRNAARRSCCSRTPSPTTSPPGRRRRHEGADKSRFLGTRPARPHLLRPHLDLHRPARHGQASCCAEPARVLRDDLDRGIPFVGLEPSCTAVLRSDAPELLPDDPDVRRLANRTRTLAELLDDHDVDPPHVPGRVVTQPHCHQHAIMGTDADLRVLRRSGADVTQLDAGCCGLAGNFGFEPGHYDLSMAVAEQALFPALRAASGAQVLADGFSCRTQIEHGTGIHAVHLAEFLASQPSGSPAGVLRTMHDAEGFRKFVAARGRALSRAAYLLTGDHAKAEDLMQETLAKAAAKWRRISAADDPEAYLKKIMINQLRTWHRPRSLVFFPTSQPPTPPRRPPTPS